MQPRPDNAPHKDHDERTTMNLSAQIQDGFHRWIDSVATTLDGLLDRLRSKREVQVIEEDNDIFVLHVERGGERPGKTPIKGQGKSPALRDHRLRIANGSLEGALPPDWAAMLRGSHAEMILRPGRFLFRPLELPKRAIEFLDGIVRAQIDRLTPWTASEAVFSWTPPTDLPNDRIALTVAATARALVAPYVRIMSQLGAASVEVLTVPGDAAPTSAPVRVFEQRARGALEIDRIRRALVALFVVTGLAAVVTLGYSAIAADSLDTEQQELARKVAARRAALRAGPEFATSAQRMLERRKQTTPSSVMVIEALSQVLPDHTYVTELHIEGDKLQVVGVTRDAPALIALIEQSQHFTHATFYAPTTRTPGDPGERFHIEAHIKPIFAVGI
jgi:general secretion pathway protein L